MAFEYRTGDILTMKKKHPCGGSEWEILRVGADFRLRCTKCGREIIIPRRQAEKNTTGVRRDRSCQPPSR